MTRGNTVLCIGWSSPLIGSKDSSTMQVRLADLSGFTDSCDATALLIQRAMGTLDMEDVCYGGIALRHYAVTLFDRFNLCWFAA